MTFQDFLEKFVKCPDEIEQHTREVECHRIWSERFISINRGLLREIRNAEPSEIKAHNADISKIHDTKAFHREIESMIDQQVYFLAERARDEAQLSFGRGTINGLRLVQERFKDLHNQHLADKKPQEEFNPYEILAGR